MGGDPLSTDTKAEGQVVFVGFGVSAPEFQLRRLRGRRRPGQDRGGALWRPSQASLRPRRPFFLRREQKLRMAAEHGAIGFITIWAGKAEQRTPFSEYVRFIARPALRWLDDKGVPNDVRAEDPRLCHG